MYNLDDVTAHLKSIYPGSHSVKVLGKGGYSHAFSFDNNSEELVIRYSKYRQDFEKDYFANRFSSPDLPIPQLISIGEAFGAYFAVSERRSGEYLDELPANQISLCIPSIFKTLDALAKSDITQTKGFGPLEKDGNGKYENWPEYLVDRLLDTPKFRNNGWYEKMQNSERGTSTFDSGYELLKSLVHKLPNERCLIHYDLLNKNVLVNNNEITAIFDWGCGNYGDFIFELATFTFWAPYIDGLKPFDWKELAIKHYAENSIEVENFEFRLKMYELFIGLDHLAYNSHLENWENFIACASQVEGIFSHLNNLDV